MRNMEEQSAAMTNRSLRTIRNVSPVHRSDIQISRMVAK